MNSLKGGDMGPMETMIRNPPSKQSESANILQDGFQDWQRVSKSIEASRTQACKPFSSMKELRFHLDHNGAPGRTSFKAES